MKNKVILTLFILVIIFPLVNAVNCWEINESNNCNYINLQDCPDGYYSEFTDCQRDLAISQLDTRNFIQKIFEDNLKIENTNKFTEYVYSLKNQSIILILFFLILSFWMIRSYGK